MSKIIDELSYGHFNLRFHLLQARHNTMSKTHMQFKFYMITQLASSSIRKFTYELVFNSNFSHNLRNRPPPFNMFYLHLTRCDNRA